jgi:Sporulation and spore germination/Putative peptidoglycan binding domain
VNRPGFSALRVGALLGFVAALACGGVSSAASAPSHVSVYFLRGEQLASVQRTGGTSLDAMRQLVAGPTPAEFRQGFRTYLPAGTRVLGVKVANGVVTADLNERFASGSDRGSLLARLSQVVRTLTGLQGATKVQLLMNGGIVAARFPGISLSRPITFRFLQTPNVAVPEPPSLRLPPPDAVVMDLQQRLIELGYLLPGDDDGRFGPATQNAVLSFQKWERLGRTGLLDSQTKARLTVATHPSPTSS